MTQLAVRPSVSRVANQLSPVWKQIGHSVGDANTASDALAMAGLDWNVREKHLEVSEAFAENRIVQSHKAIVRQDTGDVLGVVGSRYQPIQNADSFDWLTSALGHAGLSIGQRAITLESAGALRGGRIVWMLAKLPNELRVGSTDDVVHRYLLVCNSHDGSKAFRALITPIRVICQNTLTLALREGSGVHLRHTQNAMTRIPEAVRILGLAEAGFQTMQTQIDALARLRLDSRRTLRYFDVVVGGSGESSEQKREVRARLVANMDDDRQRLRGITGTLWAAFNAATQYADWERPVRGKTADRQNHNRLNSIWFGSSAEFKRRAWTEALRIAANN